MNPIMSTVVMSFVAAMALNFGLFSGHKFDLMVYAIVFFTISALILAYALNKAIEELTLFSKDELMLPTWAYAATATSACVGFYFAIQVI